MRFKIPAKAPVPFSIIPWPKSVAVTGSRVAPMGLALQPQGPVASKAAAAFAKLTQALFPVEGIARPPAEGGIAVTIECQDDFGPDAYEIAFTDTAITVSGSAHAGQLYGLITLGQILRGALHYPDTFNFPTSGVISDEPGFSWRGTHLDVARQFYSSAEISQFLNILAWNKMNRFHWHLSDDEAWRVEIDAFPELTEIAPGADITGRYRLCWAVARSRPAAIIPRQRSVRSCSLVRILPLALFRKLTCRVIALPCCKPCRIDRVP